MDFHVLTKKQSQTLCQIAKRGTVSTFFEPLLIVRELEALRLIELVNSDEFDSGLGYKLNYAGQVLAKKPAGTEYCVNGHVYIRYEPAAPPDCSEELKKKTAECADLQNQLEKVKAEVKSIQAANHRQYDTIMEKNTVICNLQRTVNDYAQRNKINMQVIRNLEARPACAWLPVSDHELTDPLEERLVPGTYVFRKQMQFHSTYWVAQVDSGGLAQDAYGMSRKLKDIYFTHYMKLPD